MSMTKHKLDQLKTGKNNLILAICNLEEYYLVDELEKLRHEVELNIIETEESLVMCSKYYFEAE